MTRSKHRGERLKHRGDCPPNIGTVPLTFAIDFVMMVLFIAWISMVIVMVPAALAFRWIFRFPETGEFFVVPLEFSLCIGVDFIIGGAWRLSRIILKGAKNSDQGA